MVVLADELLEQFFDSFFHQSFHLSDRPHPAALAAASSLSSNLTTFSNIGSAKLSQLTSASGASVAGASGGIVPPGKGLRGVLDNIVSDGIRVAAEVKKRMDEAQRELERNALAQGEKHEDDDEEEDDDYDHREMGNAANIPLVGGDGSSADPERRSVLDADRDLLEGAEVVNIRGKEGNNEDRESTEFDNTGTATGGNNNNDPATATTATPASPEAQSHSKPNTDSALGSGNDNDNNAVVSKVVEFET